MSDNDKIRLGRYTFLFYLLFFSILGFVSFLTGETSIKESLLFPIVGVICSALAVDEIVGK